MTVAGILDPKGARDAERVRCPFFRPALFQDGEVVSGYCTVPDLSHYGLNFSPPPLDACLRQDYKLCPFYCDQMKAHSPSIENVQSPKRTKDA
jgi:hypothetical protein